jgi:multidrug efflux pump subunit AcrB
VAQTLPPDLKIQPLSDLFDDSCLSGKLAQHGDHRNLDSALNLDIRNGVELSTRDDQHHDFGGLALAVGILVDDATVTIENIERHLEEGSELHDGILDGAAQIAVPALVSTLCICIVFLPMFFLSGVARYLFVPLAEAVIFAMLASYILSRTLVPTLAMSLLKAHKHKDTASRSPLARFQRGFERLFEGIRSSYSLLLARLVSVRVFFVPIFLVVCLLAFLLIPFLGQDFFPDTDSGQFILHVRAKTGNPNRRDRAVGR